MTDRSPEQPTGGDPRLAGYADGELSEADRREVAHRLEFDPLAAEILHDQEQLAAGNLEFWAAVEPPPPSEAAWERVQAGIVAHCCRVEIVTRRRRPRAGRALLALAATALLVVAALWLTRARTMTGPTPSPVPHGVAVAPAPRPVDDPLAEYAELPIAHSDEVLVEAVRGGSPAWLVAVDSPLPGDMALAGPDDVIVHEIRPSAGRSESIAVILAERP